MSRSLPPHFPSLALAGFLLMASYGIARPLSNSIFLEHFDSADMLLGMALSGLGPPAGALTLLLSGSSLAAALAWAIFALKTGRDFAKIHSVREEGTSPSTERNSA